MLYRQAEKLAAAWVDIVTAGAAVLDLALTMDKPYGWVFFYVSSDLNDHLGGNAPIIIDRCDCEIRVTGTARPVDYYIRIYERSLPKARLKMTPERRLVGKKQIE